MYLELTPNTFKSSYFSKDSPYSTILLKSGIYTHKIVIEKENLTILGEKGTIITNHDHYHKIHTDNKEYNTFRTYTVKVLSDNVTIKNLTIENSCIPSKKYGQAVALHVIGNKFLCENCILKGEQDTLFNGPLPKNLLIKYKDFLPDNELTPKPSTQKYINTTIYGDVDFIFGGATSYFYNCNIICVGEKGYVCAPSHYQELKYGFLFHECNISTNNSNSTFYLARPWRDYGSAAFIDCNIGSHIVSTGYNDWGIPARQKTCRFYEYTKDLKEKRADYVHILTKEEKEKYLREYLEFIM